MAWTEKTVAWLVDIGVSIAPTTFTCLTILVGVFVYFYAPSWGVRMVPGPPTTPLLGHLPLLAKYGPDVFCILAKCYGPVFRFHLGRQPLVIIADPELCREVAIKKFKDVPNRSMPSPISASPLHRKGLFFTRDTRWSTMRNTIVSLYQPTHLSSQLDNMTTVIESLTDNLANTKQEDITFSTLSLKMATDIIGRSAFGFDFGLSKQFTLNSEDSPRDTSHLDDEVSDFIKQHIYSTTALKMDLTGSFSSILGLLFPVLQEPFRHILKRIPGTKDWKVDQTNQKLTHRLNEIVLKRSNEHGGGRHSKDLLTLLLNARESRKDARDIFTPDYISALTYEHLLAGSATTSFTLASIIYLIAAHPEDEKKLLREIDGFGPLTNTPTAQDLQHKFPYLNQVIKEAMRFYTVSPLVARETAREVEIGGYVLPKGTWVWLALGVLAKDPQQFPEPDKFKPERFDPNCDEEKQRHPYANIPFGIGPRACIGMKFALQELQLALVLLYQRFIFRHSPQMEKPLALDYGIVLNFKHGVKLRVIKRI